MNKSTVKVNASKCPQDHVCPLIRICPAGAISQDGFSAPTIDHSKCVACGRCVITCPYKTLSFE
ncbi:MAG: 4Fe-4S binding protein [Candidatus Moranbacteria bacterium]|jgi:Fe-S-cluster-containing hydrogenase component 2|nr:4Fe-4S binding protein [Candidatus Moranbacteria bacterium]NTW89818.1 4Fe-4S binding protein [Candidatus Moranbacteria bacterium]